MSILEVKGMLCVVELEYVLEIVCRIRVWDVCNIGCGVGVECCDICHIFM